VIDALKSLNKRVEIIGQMLKIVFLKILPLTALVLAGCACLAAGEVYKIDDPSGRVIYTDTPPADNSANQLKLPPINQLPASKAGEVDELQSDKAQFGGYSVINLVAPIDQSLIHYDQQNIIVQLALTPELQVGHLVQYYLDGSVYGRPLAAISYSIGNFQRGSHTVSARVVTVEGETVANSQSVRVHVQRHFKRK
jgi:hypothetical protein